MKIATFKNTSILVGVSTMALVLATQAHAQVIVDSEETETVDLAAGETLTVTDTGSISVEGDDGVDVDGDGATITNNGLIRSNDDEAIEAGSVNNLTVINNGTIIADEGGDKGIESEENLTVINTGRIESVVDEAVEAEDAGLFLDNSGEIIAPNDDAVDGDDNVEIINSGLIQGGNNDGLELNSGSITNTGTIESLSSDPEGTPTLDTGLPELDAAIDFDAGTPGNEDGVIFNLAGGLIVGDIGIVASPGNVDSPTPNNGDQAVINAGVITGRAGDAVLLGNGDDIFIRLDDGTVNGTVDGQADDDILAVARVISGETAFNLGGIGPAGVYRGFEEFFAFTGNEDPLGEATAGDGLVRLTGTLAADQVNSVNLAGNVAVDGTINQTVFLGEFTDIEIPLVDTMLTIGETGVIDVEDDDGIEVISDGVTITNNGLIRSNDDEAIEAGSVSNLTVINNGTIIADENGDKGIESEENLTVINNGRIESVVDEAVEAEAGGLNLTNNGMIIAPNDDAVDGDDNVVIVNNAGALIQGGNNDGLELNSGTITNAGTIVSLSSDPEGTPTLDTGLPELDAAIDFDAGTPGNEDGIIMNLATGVIEGDIGIVASPGNVDSPTPNMGDQTVINYGTITGRAGDAVLLGLGEDRFEQRAGGVVNGIVDGGSGADVAVIAGLYDSDFLVNFESIFFADATFSGARTITGDVTIDGPVTLDLGSDSLSVLGDLTLAETAVININANANINDLVLGAPITVLEETANFTDNGATINLLDDDLLVDYQILLGSLLVIPGSVNPGAGSTDPNVVTLGSRIEAAFVGGTLDPAIAGQINALGNLAGFEGAAAGLLPSINTGVSREIYESHLVSGKLLDGRLADGTSGVWGQIAYRSADRDAAVPTVGSYDADSVTYTLGVDAAIGDHFKIGVAGSYSDIDIDETSGGLDNIEVENYKGSIYAGFQVGVLFGNAELSVNSSDVATARTAITGPITSAFDADGWGIRGEVGLQSEVSENLNFAATIGWSRFSLDYDRYTETGGFGFVVQRVDTRFSELRLGLSGKYEADNLIIHARGGYANDFNGDPAQASIASMTLLGQSIASDEPSNGRGEFDGGVGYKFGENFQIELAYTGRFANEYQSHGGLLRARFNF